jgi:uncharacterized membrane protein (DUF441 family)
VPRVVSTGVFVAFVVAAGIALLGGTPIASIAAGGIVGAIVAAMLSQVAADSVDLANRACFAARRSSNATRNRMRRVRR